MWETIDTYTSRMRVPGGWIVKSEIRCGEGCTVHQIFIKDPANTWKL